MISDEKDCYILSSRVSLILLLPCVFGHNFPRTYFVTLYKITTQYPVQCVMHFDKFCRKLFIPHWFHEYIIIIIISNSQSTKCSSQTKGIGEKISSNPCNQQILLDHNSHCPLQAYWFLGVFFCMIYALYIDFTIFMSSESSFSLVS